MYVDLFVDLGLEYNDYMYGTAIRELMILPRFTKPSGAWTSRAGP